MKYFIIEKALWRLATDFLSLYSHLTVPISRTLQHNDITPVGLISHFLAFPHSPTCLRSLSPSLPTAHPSRLCHPIALDTHLDDSTYRIILQLISASSAGLCPPQDTSLSPQCTASAPKRSSAHVYRGNNSRNDSSFFEYLLRVRHCPNLII